MLWRPSGHSFCFPDPIISSPSPVLLSLLYVYVSHSLNGCLSSQSYLVSLEPVEEGEGVNRHGANNEEDVEDGECDQELVEEMGPAHPSGSEERGFNVCDVLAVEVAFPFPPPARYSLPARPPSFCS